MDTLTLKELQAQIDALQQRVTALENRRTVARRKPKARKRLPPLTQEQVAKAKEQIMQLLHKVPAHKTTSARLLSQRTSLLRRYGIPAIRTHLDWLAGIGAVEKIGSGSNARYR